MNPADSAGSRVEHYVRPGVFDPHSVEALTPEQERYYLASQWRMMWWRFRQHRLAVLSGALLLLLYLSILVSEVLARTDGCCSASAGCTAQAPR